MILSNIHLPFNSKSLSGLHGINLTIGSQENLAIMGSNGAGKTTLLKVMANILEPSVGEKKLSSSFFLDHESFFSELTVTEWMSEKLTFISKEKAIQAIRDEAMQLEFTSCLNKKMNTLSSGQTYRVAFATALLSKAEVILLDEPLIHLPMEERFEILTWIKNYQKEREFSLVWSTHDPLLAFRFAKRIAYMESGKILSIEDSSGIYHHPKNPHMAKMLGHHNLFTIEQINLEHWKTPWGEMKIKSSPDKKFLLISLDRSCLEFNPEGHYEAEVLSIFGLGSMNEVTLKLGEANLLIELDRYEIKNLSIHSLIKINIRPEFITLLDCLC